jgi:hypothetical protein
MRIVYAHYVCASMIRGIAGFHVQLAAEETGFLRSQSGVFNTGRRKASEVSALRLDLMTQASAMAKRSRSQRLWNPL